MTAEKDQTVLSVAWQFSCKRAGVGRVGREGLEYSDTPSTWIENRNLAKQEFSLKIFYTG